MPKATPNNKGIVLFIVLAAIFMVILLGNIVLNIIASQSRLTHHQVSRIQAYYAARAASILAFERLRTGAWQAGPGPGADCTPASPCSLAVLDPNFAAAFPGSVNSVNIVLRRSGTAGCQNPPAGAASCINVTANYTYTP